jgi:hypothetical protein
MPPLLWHHVMARFWEICANPRPSQFERTSLPPTGCPRTTGLHTLCR